MRWLFVLYQIPFLYIFRMAVPTNSKCSTRQTGKSVAVRTDSPNIKKQTTNARLRKVPKRFSFQEKEKGWNATYNHSDESNGYKHDAVPIFVQDKPNCQ